MSESLQYLFVKSRGHPIEVNGQKVLQMDSAPIFERSKIRIEFVGDRNFDDNAAVLYVKRPGFILLSDQTKVDSVAIWDEQGLPRFVEHEVVSETGILHVYNKYRTKHRSGLVTEDSFTGNAGMIVTELTPTCRRYACSTGPGEFDPSTLMFEIEWSEAQVRA